MTKVYDDDARDDKDERKERSGQRVLPENYMCVCGPLLPRGNTDFWIAEGAEEAHRALPNEALYGVFRILGLIIPAYLQV